MHLPQNNSYPELFSPPSFLLAQIAVGKYVVWLKNYNNNNNKKSSHQLNNMSNVWVKIHCNGDGKQQHSLQPLQGSQHSQESCTLPGTQDGCGGLFWGGATTRISPSQEGFPVSESQAWISATTHKPSLRDELFVSPHQEPLAVVSETFSRHSKTPLTMQPVPSQQSQAVMEIPHSSWKKALSFAEVF